MDLNTEIKDKLETKVWKNVGKSGGGCISNGTVIIITVTIDNIIIKLITTYTKITIDE